MRRPRQALFATLIVLAAVLSIGGVLVGISAYRLGQARKVLARDVARLEVLGLKTPVGQASPDALPGVESFELALEEIDAFGTLGFIDAAEGEFHSRVLAGLASEEDWQAATAWVAEHEEVLALLETALDAPEVRAALAEGRRVQASAPAAVAGYEAPWSAAAPVALSAARVELGLRSAQVRALCLAALVHARAGEGERGAKLLLLALRHAAATDPGQIFGFLVRTALLEEDVLDAARVGARAGMLDPASLRRALLPAFARPGPSERIELMRREVDQGLGIFLRAELEGPGFERALVDLLNPLRDELSRFLDREVRGVEAAGSLARLAPPDYYRELVRGIDAQSLYVDVVETVHGNLARQLVLELELALHEHRASSGDWPETLDELEPLFPGGVPVDPHTLTPLPYERSEDGLRLGPAGFARARSGWGSEQLIEAGLLVELER